MRSPIRALSSTAALLLLAGGPASAGFQEGQRAYERGDFSTAYQEWQPLAERGGAAAQFLVGLMYEQGKGVERDPTQAVMWYRRAAEQGDVHAQFRLGFLYAHGRGIDRNDGEAAEWYGRAARQGNAAAQAMLDQMRAEGRGLAAAGATGNSPQLLDAAARGMATAQYQLGLQHATGQGGPQDFAEAVKWYRLAADQGLAAAQYQLALRYANGEGVARDFGEAVKWYRRAADQGIAFAQFNLGVRYANGQGVERDPALAYMWFSIAAHGLSGREAEVASRARDAVKTLLTPAQVTATDKLVQSWRPEPDRRAPAAAAPPGPLPTPPH